MTIKKLFAQKNTVDAHAGQAGRHNKRYAEARTQIMVARDVNESTMSAAVSRRSNIEAEALNSSSKMFLACLFILMADNTRYKPLMQ